MPSIMVRNRRMYYQDIGKGYPILFGHTYFFGRRMLQPQITTLSQNYRCIVPDLWSHGQSDEIPQRPYSVELLSQDYDYLMRHALGIKEYAVVGVSIGGLWGAQLAINHPDSVKGLVLIDAYLGQESEDRKVFFYDILMSLEKNRRLTDDLIEQIIPLAFSDETLKTNRKLVDEVVEGLKKIRTEQWEGMIELGYSIFSRNSIMQDAAMLQCPVIMASGIESKICPVELAHEMRDVCTRADHTTILGTGHLSTLEQPETTTRLIDRALSSIVQASRVEALNVPLVV